MLDLRAGPWRAALLPEQGAAFAHLEHDGRPVLRPLEEGASPLTGKAGAFWMLPWTNRLDGGRFPCAGEVYHFPIGEPAGNALHGLGREAPWVVEEAGPARAVLTQQLRRTPFDYAARLEVALDPDGLSLALRLEHRGAEPCPMGMGWHPWFLRLPGSAPRLAATHRMVTNERSLPLRAEPSDGIPEGDAGWIGTDRHFAGWDGMAVLQRPDLTVTLQAEGDWAHNLQFYAPDHLPVVCLEPVSHVPDVINRPTLAAFGAMRVLATGQALQGRVRLRVS
ncbi:aldose epimerase [Roseomonas sp. ACRSG]|nr:aldose epimerase [Roseomonas sp. ACRSG]